MGSSIFGVHAAVFYGADGKPIHKTDVITNITLTDSGDLVPRMGGSYAHPIGHFEGVRTLEVQLTAKNWTSGLYRIAAGATVAQIATLKTASNVISIKDGGAKLEYNFPASDSNLFWGAYAIVYNGATWDVYLLDDSVATTAKDERTLQVGSAVTLNNSTDVDLGIGVEAQYASGYAPEDGDYEIIGIFPQSAAAISGYTASVAQGEAVRPYVGAVFAAESQGNLFRIDVPRMKCSSGLPVNLNEKTDNEHQLTFAASALKRGDEVWKIEQVER